MYVTDRGLEELADRRGEEQVSLAWLADALRLTPRKVRPSGSSCGRLTAMNCQAPMFIGSSCTHTTSVAFG